jgi:hypothetical protein
LTSARAWARGEAARIFAADRLLGIAVTGLVAGAVAGIAMPLVALSAALNAGVSWWTAPRTIAGTFLGRAAENDGTATLVLAGTGLHLLLAAGFGMLFALVTGVGRRIPRPPAQVLGGMLWGFGRWATNSFLIAPRLPGGQDLPAAMPAGAWLVGHLVYGALLGVLVARWRREEASRTARTVGLVVGAMAVEVTVLLCGLLLFDHFSPWSSIAFAAIVSGAGALALVHGERRATSRARAPGLWGLLAGLTLVVWDAIRLA